jgi:hypothetical protein
MTDVSNQGGPVERPVFKIHITNRGFLLVPYETTVNIPMFTLLYKHTACFSDSCTTRNAFRLFLYNKLLDTQIRRCTPCEHDNEYSGFIKGGELLD